ncbi:tetratricopeptide repeat protein [Persicitalea sp.]|uniref:tetratricopeptide repeat protein n=1 Tax=Persicitalea sp. TaxID=3100273 RepID=UPI003593720F
MAFRYIFLLSLVLQLVLRLHVQAQILADKETMQSIQTGIDHIYNYEFTEADAVRRTLQSRYPGHPVTYFIAAFQMYWQYLPIKDNRAKVGEYIRNLDQCLAAVEKQYGKNSGHPEAVFFRLAARGYLALMYNYQNELLKAAGEGQKAYSNLTEALKLTDQNPEFLFVAGTYNYYVEAYPEDHAIVRPLIIFFKDGNKNLGLKQLDLATRKAVITKAEAAYVLAQTYLDHESRPDLATRYTSQLVSDYPNNSIFRMVHIQSLLLAGRYAEAERELPELRKLKSGFFPITWHFFDGYLQEKKYRNDSAAQNHYLTALKTPHDAQYTKEYHAMAYAGLARIADRSGNQSKAKEYYKKCLDLADYKSVRREAKEYL